MPVHKGKKGMKQCMDEWKAGTLHSGKNGPVVPSDKSGYPQAQAICLNVSGQSKRSRGRKR